MDAIKDIINLLSSPTISFTVFVAIFFFIFPINEWFWKWHERLKINLLWTKAGGVAIFLSLFVFFAFGLTDPNFRLIILKPDNVPIGALIFLVAFFLWYAMYQAYENDARILQGKKPNEYHDPQDKVLVWPDLVYIEFIALILCMVLLMIWGIGLRAPLEAPANPAESPNPSKAPWYFLGLQEMLVYFDPWLAGVVFPTFIIIGLMAIPYLDINSKGVGYYSYRDRKMVISTFLFGFLVLWVFLIITGTFLRGPNWSFFGPFEWWDPHKLVPLTNVNLSEFIYVVLLNKGLPSNILLREIGGFIIVAAYFMIFPPLLAKTVLKQLYEELGVLRYSVFVVLMLAMVSLPIKMYLRWIFNLKYLIAIPEFFFNI